LKPVKRMALAGQKLQRTTEKSNFRTNFPTFCAISLAPGTAEEVFECIRRQRRLNEHAEVLEGLEAPNKPIFSPPVCGVKFLRDMLFLPGAKCGQITSDMTENFFLTGSTLREITVFISALLKH